VTALFSRHRGLCLSSQELTAGCRSDLKYSTRSCFSVSIRPRENGEFLRKARTCPQGCPCRPSIDAGAGPDPGVDVGAVRSQSRKGRMKS
jgi:hypothetical protein